MVTIHLVMFGIIVYEYPQCGKVETHMNVQVSKVLSISDVVLKHFRVCLRTTLVCSNRNF